MNKFQRHISNIESLLVRLSETIGEDFNSPTSLGNAREWIIKYFLQDHLPKNVRILEGEIFDIFSEDRSTQSKQQDIIIYRGDLPLCAFGSADHKFVPCEGVLCTIEVKSKLTKQHFKKALANLAKNRSFKKNVQVMEGLRLPSKERIYTYIFCFKGPRKETLQKWSNEYERENGIEEGDLAYFPDGIICLNKYFIHKNEIISVDGIDPGHLIHWRKEEGAFFKFFVHLNQVISFTNPVHLDWNRYLHKEAEPNA